MKKVIVPLANGVEEMEAVIIIDTMRRAGWQVSGMSLKEETVIASRQVKILADALWKDINTEDFDMIVLPGGAGGTDKLCKDVRIIETIKEFYNKGKIVAAICAAPLVLQTAGILEGKKITCHPAVREKTNVPEILDEPVVIDGNIITSQGPGTTFLFALSIIALVEGKEKADTLAEGMILERKEPYVV